MTFGLFYSIHISQNNNLSFNLILLISQPSLKSSEPNIETSIFFY